MSDIKLPRVRCVICDKLVDKVQVDYDPVNDRHRIVVRCHGDKDVMEASGYQIQDDPEFWRAVAGGHVEGLAFTTKRLETA